MKPLIIAGCCLALSGCALVEDPSRQKVPQGQWKVASIADDQASRGNSLSIFGDRSLAVIGQGSENSFVLKRNPVGVVEWHKKADRPQNNFYASHYTTAGALIVAGDYPSMENDAQQAYAMSLNAAGEVNWQSQFYSADDMAVLAIDETPDGDLILAGVLNPVDSSDEFDAMADSFALRVSPEGDILWQRSIRLAQDDQIEDVLVLPEGDILALINHRDENEQSLGVHLVQLDVHGNVNYDERLLATGFSDAAAMALSPDKQSVWIVGSYADKKGQRNQHQMALLQVSPEAEVQKYFVDRGSLDAAPSDIAVLADGSIAVVGTGQQENTLEDLNVLYIHFDAAGEVIERKVFGDGGVNFADAIQVLNDGTVQVLATFNATEEPEITLISRSGA